MKVPKVSICMSTKDRPQLLRATLESLKHQVFDDFEVIIWNNGQNTTLMDEDCDQRFHFHSGGGDLGVAGGFNRALSLATGEFVLMLADDDLLYPDALTTLVRLAEDYPGYGAYFGGTDLLEETPLKADCSLHRLGCNSTLSSKFPLGYVREFDTMDWPACFTDGSLGMHLFWSAGIVRREIAVQVGAFPDYGTPLMGDLVYPLGCGSVKGAALINASICAQRVHEMDENPAPDCEDLVKVASAFPEYAEKLVSKHPPEALHSFTRQWMVKHAIFLRRYFAARRVKSRLGEVLREHFSVYERLQVMLGSGFISWTLQLRRRINI